MVTRYDPTVWPGAILAMALLLCGPTQADEPADLREFRLGMHVSELPASGYLDFSCAASPDIKLAGWNDYRRCPQNPSGRHEVRFRYDEDADPRAKINDAYEGTRVGGHPVLISALIGASGRLEGLIIATDPSARLYLRKKALLFGPQAMARYGPEGWSCSQKELGPGEEPVGNIFVREHCEKITETRRYSLDRELFRRSGEPLAKFVSNTKLSILLKE